MRGEFIWCYSKPRQRSVRQQHFYSGTVKVSHSSSTWARLPAAALRVLPRDLSVTLNAHSPELLSLLHAAPGNSHRTASEPQSPLGCAERAGRSAAVQYMEVVGCKTEAGSCTLRPGPGAMLFHGISGDHIQGIMEEMERRSKTESRLAKGMQLNGRESTMPSMSPEKPALCAGCGGKISDRYYLLAVDKQWHLRCLKCCECKLALESELTCFAKDGSIYCKEDYYRRFSVQRCARCHSRDIGGPPEMVMRAATRVPPELPTCTTCNKTLTTGDHFGRKDSLVYRRLHRDAGRDPDYHPQLNFAELAAKGRRPSLPYFNGTGTAQKGRPRKRRAWPWGIDIPSYNTGCNENDTDHLDRDQQAYPPTQKTKRMRTSFKHHQLRTMNLLAINHNPDAKDLKQLAQKTGLTKRVLQGEQILGHYSHTSRRLKIP
ncbi:LIM/homeobox protein Lhx9 isoform X4 [Lates japonicus]|uniref:LIM/homeobox protein Lhx9 n=1 Tax=Lates japonicus TaxID=270547 RepID=A0AAD3M9H2_LATJO|nr:LIM/homeobox protein Lhx9 isoform X4 [Lates japonicus]